MGDPGSALLVRPLSGNGNTCHRLCAMRHIDVATDMDSLGSRLRDENDPDPHPSRREGRTLASRRTGARSRPASHKCGADPSLHRPSAATAQDPSKLEIPRPNRTAPIDGHSLGCSGSGLLAPHHNDFESGRRLGSAKGPAPDRVQPETVHAKTSPTLTSAGRRMSPFQRRSAEATGPTARLGLL